MSIYLDPIKKFIQFLLRPQTLQILHCLTPLISKWDLVVKLWKTSQHEGAGMLWWNNKVVFSFLNILSRYRYFFGGFSLPFPQQASQREETFYVTYFHRPATIFILKYDKVHSLCTLSNFPNKKTGLTQ